MKKYNFILCLGLLVFMKFSYGNESIERKCNKLDMIGTWELITSKSIKNIPSVYSDLLEKYQVRIYQEDNTFLQLSSRNKLSTKQVQSFMEFPQNQIFNVTNGVVTTLNNEGSTLEKYRCSYFFGDFPRGNIKKGTLSLLWITNNKPLILNTYKKSIIKPYKAVK